MYVYEEYIDVNPHFSILKCIYREVSPKYTICIGSSTDAFIKSLIDTINDQAPNSTTSDIRSLPPNFYILSMKEYREFFLLIPNILLNTFTRPLFKIINFIIVSFYPHSLWNLQSNTATCRCNLISRNRIKWHSEGNVYSISDQFRLQNVHICRRSTREIFR